jgi:hypothetical protein
MILTLFLLSHYRFTDQYNFVNYYAELIMNIKLQKHLSVFSVLVLVLMTLLFLAYPDIFRTRDLSGSYERLQSMSLPATGVWNGFNNHTVVLECSNHSSRAVSLELLVKNQRNEVMGSEKFSLPRMGNFHVILNKYDIANSYGIFEINSLDSSRSIGVSCQTITYRMNQEGNVEYATSSSVGDALRGSSSGVFNSMNPDHGIDNPVYNWLSIYNPGDSPFSAVVRIRDQGGVYLPEKDIFVSGILPGERQDFALGHPDGQVVGVYEIIPEDADAKYGAFLSRYSEVGSGVYSFSMLIPSSKGARDSGMVSASTMGPALNWAELANISDKEVLATLEVFDREGNLLNKSVKELPPYSQHHEYLNQYIGELNVGYFRVQSSDPLIVQSVYYGQDPANAGRVLWAYNTMGGDPFYRLASFPVNTNLNAPNWLKIFATSGNGNEPVVVALELFDTLGEEIALGSKNTVSIRGSVDIAIHEYTGPDFTGSLYVKTLSEGSIQAQLVRVLVAPEHRTAMQARSMKELSGRGLARGRVRPIDKTLVKVEGVRETIETSSDENNQVTILPAASSGNGSTGGTTTTPLIGIPDGNGGWINCPEGLTTTPDGIKCYDPASGGWVPARYTPPEEEFEEAIVDTVPTPELMCKYDTEMAKKELEECNEEAKNNWDSCMGWKGYINFGLKLVCDIDYKEARASCLTTFSMRMERAGSVKGCILSGDLVGLHIQDYPVKNFIQNMNEDQHCIVYTDDGFHEDIFKLGIDPETGKVVFVNQFGLPPESYNQAGGQEFIDKENKSGYNPKIDAIICATPDGLLSLSKRSAESATEVYPWPVSNCWFYTESLWNCWVNEDKPDEIHWVPGMNTKEDDLSQEDDGDFYKRPVEEPLRHGCYKETYPGSGVFISTEDCDDYDISDDF